MYQTQSQAAAGTSRRPSDALEKSVAKVMGYVAENPLKVLTAGLLFSGGMFLLVYCLRIGFLPDIDLNAAASVLYAVALLGLFISSYAMATMVLPGWLLASLRDGDELFRDRDAAAASWLGACVWGALLAAPFFSDMAWWGICLAAFLGVLAVFAGVVLILVLSRTMSRPDAGPSIGWKAASVWAGSEMRSGSFLRKSLGGAALVSGLLGLPLLFALVFGVNGDLAYLGVAEAWFLLVLLVLMLSVFNAIIAVAKQPGRWRLIAVLAPLALLAVFLVTGSFSAVSAIVVRKLGLGEYRAVRAVVNAKTCAQINQALGQVVCREGRDDQASAICPVALRSRIGSQVLLEFAAMSLEKQDKSAVLHWQSVPPDTSKQVRFRRVVLGKDQLLTWTEVPMAVAASALAPAPRFLASWLVPVANGSGVAEQPPALRAALSEVCELVPRAPEAAPSAPVAASAPAVIQIDAKGSSSHQTVVNLTLSNAVSQSASTTAGAAAGSHAQAKVAVRPAARAVTSCRFERRCCEPVSAAAASPACPASAAH